MLREELTNGRLSQKRAGNVQRQRLTAVAPPDTGVGNLSLQGRVHLGAVLTVFGLPGALFVLAAISHARRSGLRSHRTPIVGSVAGIAACILIGAMIG